eukprot:Gb_10318 [translate_table: standard]
MARKPHVAIFPSPAMGHLIPLAEFAKRLAIHHHFSITFITHRGSPSSPQAIYMNRLASSGLDIRISQISEVEIEEEEDMRIETRVSKVIEKSKESVEGVLKSIQDSCSPVSAFIIDFFCTAMLDVGAIFHIPTYIFFPSPAAVLCLMFQLPRLVSEIQGSFEDVDFPITVAGLPPFPATDLPTPLLDRSNSAFNWFVYHCSRLKEATGIFINTFQDLESECIKAMVEGKVLSSNEMPSIYPVGPLISTPLLEGERLSVEEDKAECLIWLDRQPPSSVLYISFGSGWTLTAPEILELAFGLEGSGQRFLWVLRTPLPPNQTNSFFSVAKPDVPRLLPEGFESRTKDRGLVVTSWAPQIPILAHPSTGGFLSHCGWNSTLESISHGIPMIAWPIAAEQRMNSFILVNDIKVAIEAKRGSEGIVRREEVERVVKSLMDGHEGVKKKTRIRELKDSAEKALAEGGSSYKAMANVAAVWK